MQHVVLFSGGVGSWATAKRVVQEYGTDQLLLFFADTLVEDDDLYRVLIEMAADVYGLSLSSVWQALVAKASLVEGLTLTPGSLALPPLHEEAARKQTLVGLRQLVMTVLPGLHWLADGRNIWDVFFEHSLIGNTRNDPCSDELKRQLTRAWLRSRYCEGINTVTAMLREGDRSAAAAPMLRAWTCWQLRDDVTTIEPLEVALRLGRSESRKVKAWLREQEEAAAHKATFYLGYDWSEIHRFDKALPYWEPLLLRSLLCDPPLVHKTQLLEALVDAGIRLPRLYALNMPHNNCYGACVKAGQAQWLMVLDQLPLVFDYNEQKETRFRLEKGKDVSILRDYRGGAFKTITLAELRLRWEALTEKQRAKIRRAWAKPEQLPLLTADGLDLLDWGGCGCFAA